MIKSHTKCVIFDLDGTLLNTLDDLHASVNHAMKSQNLPVRTKNEVRSFVGNGIRKLIERALPENTTAETTNAAFEAFILHYAAHCEDLTHPYEGTNEMLCTLRKMGMKTAILSNKAQFAVSVLHQHFFADSIDIALGESEQVIKKPNPSGLLRIMDELGVESNETIYIGDSEVDLMTAKNAGVPCISVSWGFKNRTFLQEHGAKCIIDSPQELIETLKRMNITEGK